MKMYGLYQHRTATDYDGDTNNSTTLLGCDTDKMSLSERWNESLSEKDRHKMLILDNDFRTQFNGSTGGGYMRVQYRLIITEIDQFDDVSKVGT